MPDEDTPQRRLVQMQLALLEDARGRTLQERFSEFCERAVEALTKTDPRNGEPVFAAGKAACTLNITVTAERIADDALNFRVDHKTKEGMPGIPGKARSANYVHRLGLAQTVADDQLSLLKAADGQPRAMTIEEAEREEGAVAVT